MGATTTSSNPRGRRAFLPGLALAACLVLAAELAACRAADPRRVVEITDVEAFWAIDSAQGETQYLAPVARFRVRSRSEEEHRAVEVQANFRRVGEEASWGSAWSRVPPDGGILSPGQEFLIALKSDGRYYSTGPPESMFAHDMFKDADVEIFVRVGSSSWTSFHRVKVERRIGSREVPADVR